MCSTKRAWPSEALAEGHLLLLVAAGRARAWELHVYRCPIGPHFFHVGHARSTYVMHTYRAPEYDVSRRRC